MIACHGIAYGKPPDLPDPHSPETSPGGFRHRVSLWEVTRSSSSTDRLIPTTLVLGHGISSGRVVNWSVGVLVVVPNVAGIDMPDGLRDS